MALFEESEAVGTKENRGMFAGLIAVVSSHTDPPKLRQAILQIPNHRRSRFLQTHEIKVIALQNSGDTIPPAAHEAFRGASDQILKDITFTALHTENRNGCKRAQESQYASNSLRNPTSDHLPIEWNPTVHHFPFYFLRLFAAIHRCASKLLSGQNLT